MDITAYQLAERFSGIKEVPGEKDNPFIMSMLRLDAEWPEHDEVPWCSAFVNYIAWLLRLPRSKSLRARSWLLCGKLVEDYTPGFDVVILKRGGGDQPGPEVIKAQGHVGFYAGYSEGKVGVLGGNQGNTVSLAYYGANRILGVRRLV